MENSKSNRMGGESYILRFYYRETDAGEQTLIGLLEDPLHRQQWSFRSFEELNALLKTHMLETP